MILQISLEKRWTRTPRRGYASLRKATDPYGSRDSSHHIAGGSQEQLLRTHVKQFQGGLVFKVHRLLYHSTPYHSTHALLLLTTIVLCSKLHCQKVLDRNSFPTRFGVEGFRSCRGIVNEAS